MKTLRLLLLFALTAVAVPAFADDGPPPVTNDLSMTVDASAVAPAPLPAATPDIGAVVKDVNILVSQAHTTTAWHLALAGLIAFLLKWIVDFLMHLTNARDEVKRALPWVLGVLGVIIGVLDFYVRGASLIDAVIIGGGPPGATLFNELMNSLRKKLEKPATAAAVLAFFSLGVASCACWTSKDPAVYNSTKCVLQRQSVQCFIDGIKGVAMEAKAAIVSAIASGTVDTGALLDIAKKMGVDDGECLLAMIANDLGMKPRADRNDAAFLSSFDHYVRAKYSGGAAITYKLPADKKYTVHR